MTLTVTGDKNETITCNGTNELLAAVCYLMVNVQPLLRILVLPRYPSDTVIIFGSGYETIKFNIFFIWLQHKVGTFQALKEITKF